MRAESFVDERAFEYFDRLRKLRDYIEENLSDPISVSRAAEIAGMERHYFCHFFRQKVGTTFARWLTRRRVEEAQRRLRDHNHQITQLAFDVGFQDLRTFQRAFKRQTGMTARQYRQMNSPGNRRHRRA